MDIEGLLAASQGLQGFGQSLLDLASQKKKEKLAQQQQEYMKSYYDAMTEAQQARTDMTKAQTMDILMGGKKMRTRGRGRGRGRRSTQTAGGMQLPDITPGGMENILGTYYPKGVLKRAMIGSDKYGITKGERELLRETAPKVSQQLGGRGPGKELLMNLFKDSQNPLTQGLVEGTYSLPEAEQAFQQALVGGGVAPAGGGGTVDVNSPQAKEVAKLLQEKKITPAQAKIMLGG